MKVLHIYRTYFPDPPGGLQEAIRQICLATSPFGVESRVFTLSPAPNPREIAAPEATVIRCRSWAAPASCDLGGLDSLQEFRKLSSWADVVNFHFPWPFADLLHLLSGPTRPTVMTYHSDIVRQQYLGHIYGPLMRRTMQSVAAVVATSPAYAASSPVLIKAEVASRVRTIPLGIVDFSETEAGEDDRIHVERLQLDGKPFLLALGVLRYYKGLHTLIEAANSISGNIVIAGSGPEELALTAMAASLGAKNIVFLGQVSEQQKVVLLRRCRALVLPSHLRSEAFGMVLVEASMFGKPMVCCEVGSGTSYVNVDGETGFVVQPESPDAFASACNRLMQDDGLADRMGLAARARYERLFSGPALGRAYSDLYQEVTKA